MKMVRIGILSLQGDIEEHVSMMESALAHLGLRGNVSWVRTKEEVACVDALVIPGGESTTMGKLLRLYGIDEEIKKLSKKGVPIMGTCAGLVLLSGAGCDEVAKTGQPLLGLMDVSVERNAFGRQKESFETDIDIPVLGREKYHAVFIRAPAITKTGKDVSVLAGYNGKIVAAEKDNILLLAFHPELSGDLRMHEYFLTRLKNEKGKDL
jgi:5'-phosphate synthase pdxT subunit